MLLNYDFLELVDEPHNRNTSLTSAIDKALADKKLARQNKPRVRIKGGLSLRATLDAFGEELSRLKNQQNTTIKATRLGGIVNKIKSGLPFGTISAFRVFKPVFEKDFTEKQQKALISAYKSGFDPKNADKVAQYWQNKPTKIDLHEPIKAKDFFKGNTNIYRTLRNLFGQKFMDSYIAPKSETTMKDFMSSDKFVKKYRYTQKDNMKRTRQLKSLLDSKRHFLGYIQVIGYWKEDLKDDLIPDKETSFFVFTNEPSSTFYLRNHLLLWARQFNQAAICYCDNAKTDKVELVNATPKRFGKVEAKFTDITFSVPKELPHSLTRLKNKVYTFFEKKNMENYGVSFEELSTTKLKAMIMPKDIEGFNIPCKAYIEHHIKTSIYGSLGAERNYPGRTFDMDKVQQYELQAIKRLDLQRCSKSKSFKASYNHNIQVNNLVKALRQGKKVSRTLIAKVLANTIDTDAGYCFISDLATQLDSISPRLSKSIVTAIEQAQGLRLTYALIDKVTYNSLHNILSFVFDIDNPLNDQAFEELVVEVPREALKNVKLPQIKNALTAQIFEGAYQFKS
ncbi:hypothetical protein [Helicobacter pylori]|uniref:hypothetical protein n=1 Tax=Helicobacter pylori TaxID=210 RepID=UPI0009941EED|nr:hypothetical protein [Helicobacter pylori]OOP85875.1 hypothetical protein B0X34_03685 [Helicobacter pylori]PDW55531.1 hypothetical protein BB438_00975 [Helicobacter pylori]